MIKTQKNSKIYISIVILISVGFLCSCLFRPLTADYYHILNSGRYIVEHQEIPQYNFEFVEEGYETVIQQWLYAIGLYYAKSAGIFCVGIFTTVQLIILVVLMVCLSKRLGTKTKEGVLIALISAAFIQPYMNCRPEMFSIILLLIQFLCIEKYRESRKAAILYVLPVLTLIEINAHAMFWILHFLYLLPYIVPLNKVIRNKLHIIDNNLPLKPFILPCVLMAGSLFINPYGKKAILCLFCSSSLNALKISELSAINVISDVFSLLLFEIGVLIYLYYKNKLNSTTIYMVIGSGLLMLLMIRNIIFLSVGAVYELSYICNTDIISKAKTRIADIEGKNAKVAKALPLISIAVAIVYTSYSVAIGDTTFLKDNAVESVFTPKQAAEYLITNEPDLSKIRLFTEFNCGAYFLCNGVGKVYGTGKTEPFLKEMNGVKDLISEFAFITYKAQKEDLDAFFEEYNFDYAIVSYNIPSIQVYMDMSEDYECVLVSDIKVNCYNNYIPMYYLYKHKAKE